MFFHFVVFFKPNSKKLKIFTIMINITILETYPLKQLIPKKPKLLEVNIKNKFKSALKL